MHPNIYMRVDLSNIYVSNFSHGQLVLLEVNLIRLYVMLLIGIGNYKHFNRIIV